MEIEGDGGRITDRLQEPGHVQDRGDVSGNPGHNLKPNGAACDGTMCLLFADNGATFGDNGGDGLAERDVKILLIGAEFVLGRPADDDDALPARRLLERY